MFGIHFQPRSDVFLGRVVLTSLGVESTSLVIGPRIGSQVD